MGSNPSAIANIGLGGDTIIPMAAAAPFAQIGMAIGVLLKTKDKDLRTLAASGIIPGALAGTTELITYGILVKYKRTMVIVAMAGAIGGAINGMLGLKMMSFVLPSVLSIPAFAPMGLYLIGIRSGLSIRDCSDVCIWI